MADRAAGEINGAVDTRGSSALTRERIGREKRYVYNGDPPRSTAGYVIRPNKRGTHRKVSTFNLILAIIVSGTIIVVWVNNIITVNRLADDVGKLQAVYAERLNTNAELRAEVDRKSSWERIEKIATEQLGLTFPHEQPIWISVDPDAVEVLKNR